MRSLNLKQSYLTFCTIGESHISFINKAPYHFIYFSQVLRLWAVFHLVSKLFSYQGGSCNKCKSPVLAPTGVAAININGTTIHSGLNIHVMEN